MLLLIYRENVIFVIASLQVVIASHNVIASQQQRLKNMQRNITSAVSLNSTKAKSRAVFAIQVLHPSLLPLPLTTQPFGRM